MLSRQALLRAARTAAPQRALTSQVRFYATANDNVKPPVAVFGLDGTYATALVRSQHPIDLQWLSRKDLHFFRSRIQAAWKEGKLRRR